MTPLPVFSIENLKMMCNFPWFTRILCRKRETIGLDVESVVDGEGWLRICVDCAVGMAEGAVKAPSADVEAVATQVHTLIQQVEQRRQSAPARRAAF